MSKFIITLLATLYLFVQGEAHAANYNPTANPFADLQQAKAAAGKSGKHILLIAGGDWCN